MSFTQPCFIKRNTPELRRKLEELGMKRYPMFYADWSDDDRPYLCCDIHWYTYLSAPTTGKRGKPIDCGTNEELFLALASLRDDTAFMQWFVCDKEKPGALGLERKGNWFLWTIGTEPEAGDMLGVYYHKATVKEIIRHFSKNKQ